MNKIISLLAVLGEANSNNTDLELVELANQHGLTDYEAEIITSKDHDAICKLLEARQNVCGLLLPSEDEDGDDDNESEEIAA